MDEAATYVAAWRGAADRLLRLCAGLGPDDWATPTDCPGWTVHDVVAHLAHIESVLAAGEGEAIVAGRRQVPGDWTAGGVEQRRDRPPDALRAEVATAVLHRSAKLDRLAPIDPSARPDVLPAGVDWDWATLLRNRAIDVWVHEQDIRRAVGRPGGVCGPAAEVTVRTFAAALPFVLGKKVAPPPGTVVAWRVSGPVEVVRVLVVGDDGRARPLPEGTDHAARLTMDTETFCVLAAGRRGWEGVTVDVEGDADLARQVVDAMGVTP